MKKVTQHCIAIVDDNPVVRAFTSFLLSRHNFIVAFEAKNGQECINLMQQLDQVPDLIILDIQMPVMNGFETAVILKEKWPSIKIIALSTEDDLDSINKILSAGVDSFVSKEDDITKKPIADIKHLLDPGNKVSSPDDFANRLVVQQITK